MAIPHTFATQGAGNPSPFPGVASTPAAWLDQNFAAVALSDLSNVTSPFTPTVNFQGSGNPGLYSDAAFAFTNLEPTEAISADWTFVGDYAFNGGVAGFSQSTLRIITTAGADNANFVWGFLSSLTNSATAGQNVASYSQATKTGDVGETGAGVFEMIESVPINNPSQGSVGLEVDNRSNGTDSNLNRAGIDVVCTRFNPSGAPTFVGFGYRVQTGRDAEVTVLTGYGFDHVNTVVDVGFDTSGATIVSAAYKMAQDQAIAFDAAGTQALFYDGSGLVFTNSGATAVELKSTGDIYWKPSSAPVLTINGQFAVEAASNTSIILAYRGSDGTTRKSASIALS